MKKFGLTMFPQLQQMRDCQTLVFSDNPITSFAGLCPSTRLLHLDLDGTNIKSFDAVPDLPNLESLSMKRTPLARYKKLMLMATIVFPSLQLLNGAPVMTKIQKLGEDMRDLVGPYLREGWIIGALNPIRLVHAVTRARLTLSLSPRTKRRQTLTTLELNTLEDDTTNEQTEICPRAMVRGLRAEVSAASPMRQSIRQKRRTAPPSGLRMMLRGDGGACDPFKCTKCVTPHSDKVTGKPEFDEHVK